MAVNLSFIGGAGWQFFDDSGNPLSGGKIYTYASGTTTPQATYTSRTGTIPNSNPIILDAAGRTPEEVWSTEGLLYKYVVTDSNDVVIRTWDGIGGSVVASDLAQDLANTTDNAKGDALVGFRQSNASGFLANAVGRTVNAKLQEIVSVKDFGAVGNGVTDDLTAFNNAISAVVNGGTVIVPPGTYYFSNTLIISKNISMIGEGNGEAYFEPFYYAGVKFLCEGNTTGVVLSANWINFKGIAVVAKAKIGTNNGINVRERCRLENVGVYSFSGDGCNIDSTTSNINLWRLTNCRFASNSKNGLYVTGADSNVGIAVGLDCTDNGEWAIYDTAFLGNTYIGCHAAANGLGAYYQNNPNSPTIFLGCYSESGQPPSEMYYPSVVISGLQGAGFKAGSTAATYGNYQGLPSTNGLLASRSQGGVTYSTAVSGDPNVAEILRAQKSDTTDVWRLKWTGNNIKIDLSNLYNALTIYGNVADSGVNRAVGIPLLLLGQSTKRVSNGAAAPVAGTYAQGDIVFNDAPAAGGYVGWVCVTGGTPGTWKTFGAISP